MKGDNTMEADRYRRELERKDRDISSVDEAIERIFAEEKERNPLPFSNYCSNP